MEASQMVFMEIGEYRVFNSRPAHQSQYSKMVLNNAKTDQ
jgi:hypothetical protein